MSDQIPAFASHGWYRVRGRGWCAVVQCDVQRDRSNPGLEGLRVRIDGELFMCIGVDRNMPATPIYAGEKIGLVVREAE